jgi:hypothetical protein
MATRKLKLVGKAEWAKVFPENRDMIGFVDPITNIGKYAYCDGKYCIDVYLDPAQAQDLKRAGSVKRGTVTEQGWKVKFDREHAGRFEWASGPPVITMAGQPRTYEDGPIGNGSLVEVTVSVYDTPGYCGTRLEAVNVLELVEYTRTYDDEAADEGDDNVFPQ